MPVKNFDVPFLDIKGKQFENRVGDKIIKATMADVAIGALDHTTPEDQALPPRERNGLISLGIRIAEGGEREYSTHELGKILERCQKTSTNIAYFRMTELIDGPDAVIPPKE